MEELYSSEKYKECIQPRVEAELMSKSIDGHRPGRAEVIQIVNRHIRASFEEEPEEVQQRFRDLAKAQKSTPEDANLGEPEGMLTPQQIQR